jgi:hypothetical protein
MQPRRTELATSVVALVLLGSCAFSGTGPGRTAAPLAQPLPAVVALPRPADLPLAPAAPRAGSLTEADILRQGAQYEAGLAHDRVTAAAPLAVFSPAFAPAGSGLDGCAYAIYRFQLSGYDREPLLRLSWDAPPPAGALYLGLANFASDRWDWQQPASSAQLELAALAPYTAGDGSFYVAVLLLGDQPASLTSLRLGEAYPVAVLEADALSGEAPLLVSFDASGSTTPEGTLTLFDWDFDGDGVYDQNTGTTPAVQHNYATPGTFAPAVRVTNSLGHSATASLSIEVTAPAPTDWMHFMGTSSNDWFNAVAVDGEGNIYAAGVSNSPVDGIGNALLTKWTAGGGYLWGRIWELGANYSEALDVAVDSSGNPVVAGRFYPPPGSTSDGIVLKWAPNGDLSWARSYSGSADDKFIAVSCDGTDIYVTGESDSLSSDDDLLLLRIAGDSSYVWARRYDWFEDRAVGAELLVTGPGAQSIFALVTETNPAPSPDAQFPLWVRYGLNGDFEADGCSSTYDDFYAESFALEYEPLSMVTKLYMTGFEGQAGGADMVLLATDSAYNGLFCRTWETAQGARTSGIAADGSGGLLVAGHSDYDAGLWRFSAADGSIQAAQLFVNPDFDSDFTDLMLLGSDVLCVGYGQGIASSWQDAAGTQSSASHTWSLAAGNSFMENLSLGDPAGDSTVEWTSPVLDTGGGMDDCIITRRAAP